MDEAEQNPAIQRMNTCCIAERLANGEYKSCPRRMVGFTLGKRLRELSIRKRFPFGYNQTVGHHYICLYHRRLIHNEPMLEHGEILESRSLLIYEIKTPLTTEELLEIADDPILKIDDLGVDELVLQLAGTNVGAETVEEETESVSALLRLIKDTDITTSSGNDEVKSAIKSYALKSKQKRQNCYDAPVTPPLHDLPRSTLRRYCKTYGLPIPSSTLSKQQLANIVIEHFKKIDVGHSARRRIFDSAMDFRISDKKVSTNSIDRSRT